jgi:DNA (cytosine-5)-methyltransferase 1
MGYARAGFEVVGVDVVDQPRYPFEFIRGDALDAELDGFDAIHASPPCQAFSTVAKQARLRYPGRFEHPDLVDATRSRLEGAGVPWVMENVQGAPFRTWFRLCGSSFGLDLRRHRIFETGGGFDPLLVPPCAHSWQTPRFKTLDKRRTALVSTVPVHGQGNHLLLASVVGVHGHLNYTGEQELRERAMGIDWMNTHELVESIPPAYTEWIGTRLLEGMT